MTRPDRAINRALRTRPGVGAFRRSTQDVGEFDTLASVSACVTHVVHRLTHLTHGAHGSPQDEPPIAGLTRGVGGLAQSFWGVLGKTKGTLVHT